MVIYMKRAYIDKRSRLGNVGNATVIKVWLSTNDIFRE